MQRRRTGVLLLAALLTAAVGCGTKIKRVDVKGTVKFDGKPIEKGDIRFIPLDKGLEGGMVGGGPIIKGNYEAVGQNGAVVGKCRVEITATRLPPGYKQDPNVPFVQEQQYIPEKYNVMSKLDFVVPDKGPVEKDFALTK